MLISRTKMDSKLKKFDVFLIELAENNEFTFMSEKTNTLSKYIENNKITDDDMSYIVDHYSKELKKAIKSHPLKNKFTSYGDLSRMQTEHKSGKSVYKQDKTILNLKGAIEILLKIYVLKPQQLDYFSAERLHIDDEPEYKDMEDYIFTGFYVDALRELQQNLIIMSADEVQDILNEDIITIIQNFDDKDILHIKKCITLFEHFIATNPKLLKIFNSYTANDLKILKSNFKEIAYLKDIIGFKSLPKNDCLKKLDEYHKKHKMFADNPKTKTLCENNLGNLNQKKFGLRSFQKMHKDEDDGDSRDDNDDRKPNNKSSNKTPYIKDLNEYYSDTHWQQQMTMSVNFDSTFGSYVCSSVNVHVDGSETDQIQEIGDISNIADILIEDGHVILNPNSWDTNFPCYNNFHKKGKPYFIKLHVPGHIFCAFIIQKTKEIEIWDTGDDHHDYELIMAGIFKNILPDYTILIINTKVQGSLKYNYQKKLSTENEWVDTYCQTWIYLNAYLRFVLNYTPTEIILYILSLEHNQRLMMINAFQTQLSNNGDNLKYLDVVQDMIKKGWKNRLTKIKESLDLAFDGSTLKNIERKIDYIFESAVEGKQKYDVELRSKSTSGTFENYFWTDFSTMKVPKELIINSSNLTHINKKNMNRILTFFNKTPLKGGSSNKINKYHSCSKCNKHSNSRRN